MYDLVYIDIYNRDSFQSSLASESTLPLNLEICIQRGCEYCHNSQRYHKSQINLMVETELNTIGKGYTLSVEDIRIKIIDNKLVVFWPIFSYIQYIGLIIVTQKLCQIIFSNYHTGPSAGNITELKTLFWLRNTFFWPGLQKYVKEWVKGFANCISYNTRSTWNSGLYL